MSLREVLRNKKLNNKGSAIVLVIIAMGFIGVMATSILWMAYMNYMMKVTDQKATNNFYTAEEAAEQIKVGLQEELSSAISSSYSSAMQLEESTRETAFLQLVVSKLKTSLGPAGGTGQLYDVDHIKSYISPDWMNPVDADGNSAGKGELTTDPADARMTISSNSILLKDVELVFTDARGYTDTIHTDYRITVPAINFAIVSEMPDYLSYALITDQKITGNTGCNIYGSVYAGGLIHDNTLSSNATVSGNSMELEGGEWNFNDAAYVIAGQNVQLNNGASFNTKGDDTQLWARNITMTGSLDKVNLEGKSYVADDLTFNGQGDSAVIKGSYFGFGVDEKKNGDDSSAILINGKNSYVDISGVEKLWIGGRSYIGGKDINKEEKPLFSDKENQNVPMSESIAVKGDQIAFLVPAEALAKLDGESIITSNPVTEKEYTDKILANKNNPLFKEYDFGTTLMPGTEEYLSDYTTEAPMTIIPQGTGLVFYYMVMDSAHANAYLQKYYSIESNKKTMDANIKRYLKTNTGIVVNDKESYTRFDMAGNYVTYKDDEVAVNTATDTETRVAESTLYTNSFEALNAVLMETCTYDQLSKTVFDNLVDEAAVLSFIGKGNRKVFDDENGNKAIVTTEAKAVISAGEAANARVILATGDVVLEGSVPEGIVIAKGDITVSAGVSKVGYTNSLNKGATLEKIKKVLASKLTIGTKTAHLYEFFTDCSQYELEDDESASVSGNSIDSINDMVIYENWNKR